MTPSAAEAKDQEKPIQLIAQGMVAFIGSGNNDDKTGVTRVELDVKGMRKLVVDDEIEFSAKANAADSFQYVGAYTLIFKE